MSSKIKYIIILTGYFIIRSFKMQKIEGPSGLFRIWIQISINVQFKNSYVMYYYIHINVILFTVILSKCFDSIPCPLWMLYD